MTPSILCIRIRSICTTLLPHPHSSLPHFQLVTPEQHSAILGVLGQVHISEEMAEGGDLKAKEQIKVRGQINIQMQRECIAVIEINAINNIFITL